MKRKTLNIMIAIAVISIPFVCFLELNFEFINGWALFVFGIYSFIVCTLYFVSANKLWKKGGSEWKEELERGYIVAALWAFCLSFMIMIYSGSDYIEIGIFLFLYLSLLLPLGVILFVIGILGLKDGLRESRKYFWILLTISILFVIVGMFSGCLLIYEWEGFAY